MGEKGDVKRDRGPPLSLSLSWRLAVELVMPVRKEVSTRGTTLKIKKQMHIIRMEHWPQ